MAVNGSGIRDTARVLHISPSTVIHELKKTESALESVNRAVLERLNPSNVLVKIQKVEESEEAELDEMWSYVGNKENQRWLWHAIDHHSGEVLAYVFGSHEDAVFLELKNSWLPLVSRRSIRMIGGRTNGIYRPPNAWSAKPTPKRSNGNI